MKHLSLFETFIDEYYTEINRLKKEAIDRLSYIGTSLIDDFGFDIHRKGFSFVKNTVVNFYSPDNIEVTPELLDELRRVKNRLKEYNLKLKVSIILREGQINREAIYSDEFGKSILGKTGQMFVFIMK